MLLKSKPADLKYTDLCIYIDKTVYNRDEHNNPISLRTLTKLEEETVFNYLYNVIYALTVKKKLLNTKQEYEEFSIDFAIELFLRITNKEQDFTYLKKRLTPIKSILNYIKGILNFSVIDYRVQNYKEVLTPDYDSFEDLENVKEYLEEQVRSNYQKTREELYNDYFLLFPKYLKKVLNNSPFKNNLEVKNNLSLSILLTLNNFLTLPNKYKRFTPSKRKAVLDEQIDKWRDYIIIWEEQGVINKPLVILYIQKIFESILRDMEQEEHDSYMPDNVVKDILSSSLPTYGTNQKIGD